MASVSQRVVGNTAIPKSLPSSIKCLQLKVNDRSIELSKILTEHQLYQITIPLTHGPVRYHQADQPAKPSHPLPSLQSLQTLQNDLVFRASPRVDHPLGAGKSEKIVAGDACQRQIPPP